MRGSGRATARAMTGIGVDVVAGRTGASGSAKGRGSARASDGAAQGGISIPPSDWDVRCTAVGGTSDAATWNCQATSSSGQCSGSIVAYATAPGVAATKDDQIACGE